MANFVQYAAVGRRKTSTARVYLRPGNGAIQINHKPAEQYFKMEMRRQTLLSPLVKTGTKRGL